MIKYFILLLTTLSLTLGNPVSAAPKDDIKILRDFFKKRFPDLTWQDYADGIYAIDPISRETWEAIEEFPPYEIAIEDGAALFSTAFANGKHYADCFPNKGMGIAQRYPYWDKQTKSVITLPLAINTCRSTHGEKPLAYQKGDLAAIVAYMADTSRGNIVNVEIPENDADALAAYENGKQFYFARRGQLNFSCAHCHIMYAGSKLRSDMLSPMLGQTTGWPTYRAKWGAIGTLHRRFRGCNKQVRAKPLKAQSEAYRNLEYYLTHVSNGLTLNGPSSRR